MANRSLLLVLTAGLAVWLPVQGLTIDSHEVPSVIGTYGKFKQNSSSFTWPAFDTTRTHWDLTSYPGGQWSRVGVANWTTGAEPAPESMAADAPSPQVLEIDTLGDNSMQYVYEYEDSTGLHTDGIDFTLMSYRVIGNYRPDAKVYASPMQYGTTWSSDVDWTYEIIQGLPYSATETHSKKIVASGKVKVPVSGDYYWPCLVIQDSMHFEDNFGDNDTRWLYEWVVPGAFSGANGVAAALSQSDANRDFTDVATMMQLAVSSIPNWDVRPPAFSHTREWQDTTFVGPYVVWSVIQDNDVVGQESLLYRVDSAAWAGTAPDSSRADTFYFTIPSVAHSSRVDYYVWARDSFCTANNVDLWTTWPVCSPESTMITFHVNIPGTAEQQPAMPGHIGLSASPNPFGGATTFYFNYPNVRRATVKVFASSGELVRTLAMWPVPTLGFQARWDGRNDMGEPVPAGTYLCRVECPGYTEAQKVTLTR